jgi:chaperonin cofactor prefoldin
MMKWFTKQMHNSEANFKALQDKIQKELRDNATSRFGMI